MRKILLLLFLLCSYFSAFSQTDEVVDKSTPDGKYRMIVPKLVTIKGEPLILNATQFAVQYYKNDGKDELRLYFLIFAPEELRVKKSERLIIKLKDNSMIELKSEDDAEDVDGTYNSNLGTYYYITPSYLVTPSQLKKMTTIGVQKMRMEKSLKYEDYTFEDNLISDIINSHLKQIEETKSKKDSFYDEF